MVQMAADGCARWSPTLRKHSGSNQVVCRDMGWESETVCLHARLAAAYEVQSEVSLSRLLLLRWAGFAVCARAAEEQMISLERLRVKTEMNVPHVGLLMNTAFCPFHS